MRFFFKDAVSTNDLIGEQCSKTRNEGGCLEILKYVPGASDAKDLIFTLANVTIPFTYSRSMATYLYIKESPALEDSWSYRGLLLRP